MKIAHGTRAGYKKGCRCEPCTAANREYFRAYRAAKCTGLATVTPLKAVAAQVSQETHREPGPNELAVIEQTAQSAAAAVQPATVAMALTMARVLDDEKSRAMHPQATRQLHALLTSLAPAKRKSRGRLARVQSMTSGTAAR